MTSLETIRTVLAALWDTEANAYEMAMAVMKAVDIESGDIELEVESVISRALKAKELVDLSKVAAEVAKLLPAEAEVNWQCEKYAQSVLRSKREESQPEAMPLCEAMLADIETTKTLANGDGNLAHAFMWKSALKEAEAIIRKHFAALSVEGLERVIEGTDGGVPELAQAIMRLLRKE